MHRFVDKSHGVLFCSGELRTTFEHAREALKRAVEAIDGERLLNTATSDLVQYLVDTYSIEPIHLLKDKWTVEDRETRVDVSRDPGRYFSSDRGGPFYVAGHRYEVAVPFSGERELFFLEASTSTSAPPRALVRDQELLIVFEVPHDSRRDLRADIDRVLAEIERHLGWSNSEVRAFNAGLPSLSESAVTARRDRLLAAQHKVASLGIPAKPRVDRPQTYSVPAARRKVAPVLPPASMEAFEPEPVWELVHYEEAIRIMQSMAKVMERTPSAFSSMDEEDLRTHFLVQLNGQFEGAATGETFNAAGKTDILLREKDRNVFIAECKFWGGPKKFRETVDQLLGYAAWRDTKTVILVFNRGTETSTVLRGVDEQMNAHPNSKRRIDCPHESGMRYVLHQNGDRNRELVVTVLVFDVPTKPSSPDADA